MAFRAIVPYENFKFAVLDAIEGNNRPENKDKHRAQTQKEYIVRVGEQASKYKIPAFGGTVKGGVDAKWESWIEQVEFELDDFWNTVRNLTRHTIGDLKEGTAQIEHAFAVHYRLHADFERTKFAKNIDEYIFGKSAVIRFDGPVFEKVDVVHPVRLGAFKVSLRKSEDLWPLRIKDDVSRDYLVDGEPNIFGALHWQNNLTKLHGRDVMRKQIVDWARDKDTHKVKIMLISGPGGAGKSRLAAEVASKLVEEHRWAGGFPLRALPDENVEFNGVGNGVVLIIDYPEEDKECVKKIITAAATSAEYEKPVRIILTSREDGQTWRNRFPPEKLPRFEEVSLVENPYRDDWGEIEKIFNEQASDLARETLENYAERVGYEKRSYSGIEEWIERDKSHRQPLNVLAASIHAVLDPDAAFKLGSKDILLELADIELRRVRFYSIREFVDENVLEKLLALSMFTKPGLSGQTLVELGKIGICNGKNGNAVLEAAQRTPFWQKEDKETPEHVRRPEPGLVAAGLFSRVFFENNPPPSLSDWLVPVVKQAKAAFADTLGRIILDLSNFESGLGQEIETITIRMVDHHPEVLASLEKIAFQKVPFSSTNLALKISEILLQDTEDDAIKAAITNNQAALLSNLGRQEEALSAIEKAVSIRCTLAKSQSDDSLSDLATSLSNQSWILSGLERQEEALSAINEAVLICDTLAKARPDIFLYNLAASLNNQSRILSDLGRQEEALSAIEKAVPIRRTLAEPQSDGHLLSELAMSLNNQSSILSNLERREEALLAIEDAVSICGTLAKVRPYVFLPDLAGFLNNKANILSDLRRNKEALLAIEKAVSIRHMLAKVRPDVFLPDLAGSLNNKVNILSDLRKQEGTLSAITEAVTIYRTLAKVRPDILLLPLAGSLNDQAIVLSHLEQRKDALLAIKEAIQITKPFFLNQPQAHAQWIIAMGALYIDLCEKMSIKPEAELLDPIVAQLSQL